MVKALAENLEDTDFTEDDGSASYLSFRLNKGAMKCPFVQRQLKQWETTTQSTGCIRPGQRLSHACQGVSLELTENAGAGAFFGWSYVGKPWESQRRTGSMTVKGSQELLSGETTGQEGRLGNCEEEN